VVHVGVPHVTHDFELDVGQIVVDLPRTADGAKVFLSRHDELVQRRFEWRDVEDRLQVTFDSVAAGDHVVALVVPVGAQGADVVADFARVTISSETRQQRVRLDALTTVPCRFIVTRPDGRPAGGARVYARPAGSPPECWRSQGLTDEQGELQGFGFEGLGIVVEAECPSESVGALGYVSAPRTFAIDGRSPAVVDIGLVGAAGVRVRMGVDSGEGWSPILCQLFDAEGESSLRALRAYEFSTEHDFGPLWPGKYTVKIRDLDGREFESELELEGGRVRWFDAAGRR